FAGVLAVIYGARKIIWITIINRRLAFAVALTAFSGLVLIVDAYVSNGPSMGTVEDMLLIAMAIVGSRAAGLHRSLCLPAARYLAGDLPTRVIGVENALYVTSAANALLFITLYALLRRWTHPGAAVPDAR